MKTNFYNKVAKKFGGYGFSNSQEKYFSEYPHGDPEEVFKKKLLDLATKKTKALDVGCGDCKFAFQIANHFQAITGIDTSEELLKIAQIKQEELKVKNITFTNEDASNTSFKNNSFELVFSRRGPTPYPEFKRLLKSGGHFVGIEIGEKDCQAIKEIFGRGQGYKKWDKSRLEIDKQKLIDLGFEIVFAQDYFYSEYYASYYDLDLFLQGVPIFEDFDSEKDKQLLETYVGKSKTKKGIKLPRHRIVMVAKSI
ncbi:methyltransferase domain-containing protein [Candidatus Beckwithbacteria bacterium]|nr:methyltransferase domain-containing protein [Candidatus Beckwithbacteria bacterium]